MRSAPLRKFLLALAVLCGGMALVRATPPVRHPRPLELDRDTPSGLVIVVEGIGGIDCVGAAADKALPKAGVRHQIRHFVWTHGRGKLFKDLQDFRYMQKKAEDLAEEILDYKKHHPDRPIYLVGKSGGCGVVLKAAENLPPATLDRIVLLSAAVTADYDLRPALQATRREIISYYSIHDQFILGWGTSQFGTIDRVYGPSAGLRGFVTPRGMNEAEQLLYGRLIQIPWKRDMIWEGHFGTHMGTSMPGFVGKEVAPWLK